MAVCYLSKPLSGSRPVPRMILNDGNLLILVTPENITVLRKNSALKYNHVSFSCSPAAPLHGIVRVIDSKIYEYTDNAVLSHQTGSVREFTRGPILDLYKSSAELFFIKNHVNSRYLVDKDGKVLTELPGPFYFEGGNVFFMDGRTVKWFDLHSKACRTALEDVDPKIDHFICRDNCFVFTGLDGKIHIQHSGSACGSVVYHYHSNKILGLVLVDDYVISAGKDGKIAIFSILREEKQLLFNYPGRFVDIKADNNRIYLLTSFCYGLESVLYEEILPEIAEYKFIKFTGQKEEENDIFKMKRTTKITIENRIKERKNLKKKEEAGTDAISGAIGFTQEERLFLIRDGEISAEFALAHGRSFISKNKLFCAESKRTKSLLSVYDIFANSLVLVEKVAMDRHGLDGVYFSKGAYFYKEDCTIYRINSLGLGEAVYSSEEAFTVHDETDDLLLVLDGRGLYDVCSGVYLLKQKKIAAFCVVDGHILFYIENRGLYLEGGAQEPLLKLAIQDIAEEGGNVRILHTCDEQRVCGLYALTDTDLELLSENFVEANCCKIIHSLVLSGNKNQLIIA